MTGASPTPRRVRAPRWLDPRLAVGVALVLGSVLTGAIVIHGARHTSALLAVRHDVAAGAVLGPADVTTVPVQLPAQVRTAYLGSESPALGQRLTRGLRRGELVPTAALSTPVDLATVVVPLVAGAAPPLSPGQRLEVWLSTKACPDVVLLRDVVVQSVEASAPAALTDAGGQDVVVSVPADLAGRIVDALAQPGGTVRAAVLLGPAGSGANDELPDLSLCRAGSP